MYVCRNTVWLDFTSVYIHFYARKNSQHTYHTHTSHITHTPTHTNTHKHTHSPVDSKYINIKPVYLEMTKSHVIAASTEWVFVWQFKNMTSGADQSMYDV